MPTPAGGPPGLGPPYTAVLLAPGLPAQASKSLPVRVLGNVTATFTMAAGVPTSVTVGAAKHVPGATAVLSVYSAAGSLSFSGGPAVLNAATTAQVFMDATPGTPIVGTYLPGDLVISPLSITGTAGSKTLAFNSYTTSVTDPGGTSLATAWLRYVPPYGGTLTLSVPSGTEVYIVTEGSPDPYDVYSAAGTVDFVASSPVLIAWGAVGSTAVTKTLTFAFTASTEPMNITVSPTIVQQTPTSVLVYLIGGPISSNVVFAVSGYPGTTTSVATDSAGTIAGASISIPAVPAGTAIITATAGTSSANCSLSVLSAPPSRPTTQTSDAAPGLIAQTGVVKWVLFDPSPGGTTYTFPINPSSWSSPHAPRNVLAEATTEGNPILWEGAIRSHAFTFSGYLDSQTQYDAMEAFRDLNHRHWIVDHRNRAWVCSIDSIEWTPRRVLGKPWAYNYLVHAQVYKGPVAL